MRMIPVIVRAGLLALAAIAGGCGSDHSGGGGGKLQVVVTTMQLQDFARQVGGDRVEVDGILGPDSEPHEYEPRPSDADAVAAADVVVENGANLDGWLGDLLRNAGGDATRVTASEGIELLPTEEKGFPGDPHIWHDPELAKRMVDAVATGLSEADPSGKATYQAGARRYKGELDAMARRIRADFASVPADRRKLVTSHDAFGYFARAYGIEVVGSVLSAVTTDAEPSGQQVRELIDDIQAERVDVIFTEEAVDAKLEKQIAGEAGARVSTSLYADVLGAKGSGAETFIEAELANARAMKEAWAR